MKLLFCSDIHGNCFQYDRIFRAALEHDAIIIGGDLSPKAEMIHQRKFLETFLIPELEFLKEKKPELKIFLVMGNNDWAGNMDLINRHDGELFENIGMRKAKLSKDFDIIGYPFVPITPFRMKDWDKWDLSDKNKREKIEKERAMMKEGITSIYMRYEPKKFDIEDSESIEKDMHELFSQVQPEKTIFVFHAPPYNTYLDMLHSREHAGSLGIRMGIEKHQPYLSLHGHIHETVDISGRFMDKIGDTLCATCGNHYTKDNPFVLSIGLHARNIERIKLQ